MALVGTVMVGLVGGAGVGRAAPAFEPDTLPVPPVPASLSGSSGSSGSSVRVALPPAPRFELPGVPSGLHSVRELRVRGRALLGRELTVAGYIAWIYDCVEALTPPGGSRRKMRQLVDDHPELCDRPKFYLGTQAAAAGDSVLWVVEVPRLPNKRERAGLTPKQLANWPSVPSIALGQRVAVTGKFALRAPGGDQSSDGLLVYRALSHAVPSPGPAVVIAPGGEPPQVVSPAPLRAVVPRWRRNESIDHYEACNAALEAGQLDAAMAACLHAVESWPGNHLAWYALGNAHGARGDWRAARAAYDHCVELRPDQAMYQLYNGIALFELAQASLDVPTPREDDARGAPIAARKVALAPYQLAAALAATISRTDARLALARRAFSRAAAAAPTLWLAHHYLGRIALAQDRPADAAIAFSRAIQAAPSEAAPYVALIELYRTWDLSSHALAVAQQGVAHASTAASLWYELGMVHAGGLRDDAALAAFDRAVAGGNVAARFQRGQIYLRRHALVDARRELEAFRAAAAAEPSLAMATQMAHHMLAEIARRQLPLNQYISVPNRELARELRQ